MNQLSLGDRESRNFLLKIVSIGIVLLGVGVYVPPPFSGFIPVMHLVEDIGIAFVVAAIVGELFELGARRRFQEAVQSGTIHAVLGDWIGPDIWRDVNNQIFERKALRKNVDIRFKLFEDPKRDLPDNAMVLWLREEYDLCLKEAGKKDRIEVEHYLLSHNSYADLPRFTKVEVGGKTFPIESTDDGILKLNVDVEGRDGNPIRVIVEREEVIQLPGMYTLFAYEMSRGIRLLPLLLPKDVEASVNVLPPISSTILRDTSLKEGVDFSPAELENLLLLPGQAIELWVEKRG
jgi:hypothetical protein